MSDQNTNTPELSPEVRRALLEVLDEIRAEITGGHMPNLALIRFNAEGQILPTIVGNAERLHFALELTQAILVQSGLNALRLCVLSAPRTYFASHETGQA